MLMLFFCNSVILQVGLPRVVNLGCQFSHPSPLAGLCSNKTWNSRMGTHLCAFVYRWRSNLDRPLGRFRLSKGFLKCLLYFDTVLFHFCMVVLPLISGIPVRNIVAGTSSGLYFRNVLKQLRFEFTYLNGQRSNVNCLDMLSVKKKINSLIYKNEMELYVCFLC